MVTIIIVYHFKLIFFQDARRPFSVPEFQSYIGNSYANSDFTSLREGAIYSYVVLLI